MDSEKTKEDTQAGSPARMSGLGWQPIETAPKKYRILLGFSKPVYTGVSAIFGDWDDDKYAKTPRPYWTHDMVRITGIQGARGNQPTHWMPNIEAPTLNGGRIIPRF